MNGLIILRTLSCLVLSVTLAAGPVWADSVKPATGITAPSKAAKPSSKPGAASTSGGHPVDLEVWQDLPNMGLSADNALSPSKEEKLGAQAVRQLRQQGAILEDPELKYYLQSLGERLVAVSPGAPFKFHYLPIKDPTINSFAMPGGYIGIQTGLIDATHNQDELAAVMAHETGHEVQRHIARQALQDKNLSKLSIASLLAGVAAGALTGNPELGIAAFGAGTGTAMQKHINYTRHDEEEADRTGIRMLAAAGFNPMAMATFFQRLARDERLSGGTDIPPILQNHPVTSERIADAEARASQYPKRKSHSPLNYRIMRARARVLASPNLDDTATYFQGQNPKDPAVRYGLALTWAKQGKLDKARQVFVKLANKYPKNVHLGLELAKIEQIQGHIQTALDLFRKEQQAFPDYPPLTLAYADALEQGNQFRAARQLLLHSDSDLDSMPQTHRLLAVAANRTQQPAEARYQLADYYFLQGDYESAIRQLQAGLKMEQISPSERSKLKAKLKQVQKIAPKGQKGRGFSVDGEDNLSGAQSGVTCQSSGSGFYIYSTNTMPGLGPIPGPGAASSGCR